MMKRIIHIVIWVLLACWFTIMMGFVSKSEDALLCKQIIIEISDSVDIRFVTSESVRNEILESGINTQGYPVYGIQTRNLEFLLEKNPYIENAEVYTNVEGDLFVDISQRRPLLRIMPGGKKGYFIDHSGVILPLSENYSPMVLLLSGYIEIPEIIDPEGMRRVDTEKDMEIQKLMGFAKLVEASPLWSKQIVQVYRASNGDFELIPRVGAHQIQFGPMNDYKTKLANLKLLYDKGLKQYGWNTYNKINLKYSNQIICTKR